MVNKNIHAGHRKRLREKYINHGLDCFADHEVLELLLTYVIPRKDTNALAHHLIDEAGGFREVFNGEKTVFDKVNGASENARVFLQLVRDVGILYRVKKFDEKKNVLNTSAMRGNYCKFLQEENRVETLYMVCLSASYKALCVVKLAEGDIDNVPIYIKRIINKALEVKAKSVLLTHNHPGGVPMPTDEDVRATFEVIQALRAIDVDFCDHIIVGDNGDWVSFKESGIV